MSRPEGAAPGQIQAPYEPPPGATEIIVVRHGAALDLEHGAQSPPVDGRDDPPLSPLGLAQAEAVSRRLAQEPIDRLFVTPLMRTAMTVAPLVARTGKDAEVLPELIEVFLGDYDGRAWRRAGAAGDPLVARVLAEERWDVLPGSEPAAQVTERVALGLARIVERTGPDGLAAVVVHGGIIAEILRAITGSRPFAFINADNAGLSRILHLSDGRWTLRSFNDISHLAEVEDPA